MSALPSPAHDHPTTAPAVVVPAQRGAPPVETLAAEPGPLRRPRPGAVWGIVAGMAAGAVGTLVAAAIVTSPATVPAPAEAPRQAPEPRVAFDGTVSVPGRELTTFGDGTWQVGVDVVPGTYASTGGVDCRHALRPAVTGRDIAQSAVDPGPTTVVLAEGDGYFATSGCGTWTRVG